MELAFQSKGREVVIFYFGVKSLNNWLTIQYSSSYTISPGRQIQFLLEKRVIVLKTGSKFATRMAPNWPRVIQLNLAPRICCVTLLLYIWKNCWPNWQTYTHPVHQTPWKSQQFSFSVFSCSRTHAPFTLLYPRLIPTSLINLLS